MSWILLLICFNFNSHKISRRPPPHCLVPVPTELSNNTPQLRGKMTTRFLSKSVSISAYLEARHIRSENQFPKRGISICVLHAAPDYATFVKETFWLAPIKSSRAYRRIYSLTCWKTRLTLLVGGWDSTLNRRRASSWRERAQVWNLSLLREWQREKSGYSNISPLLQVPNSCWEGEVYTQKSVQVCVTAASRT